MEIAAVQASHVRRTAFGIAARPTLLFVVAFALNASPHEAAHALTSYFLGLNSTLFQMWVDPDVASATPMQLAVIALAGPIFSLLLGLISWMLYRKTYNDKPAGLFWLMLTMVGIYSFLGPTAGAAIGGDIANAFRFLSISKSVQYAVAAMGSILLPVFMFFIGKELSGWMPPNFGRTKTVLCTTAAPWLIGPFLIVLLYWPLPRFLVASTFTGSLFWVFAVIGAAVRASRVQGAERNWSLTRFDLVVTAVAVAMVRVLAQGIRLAH
jgi:hypothetical protein